MEDSYEDEINIFKNMEIKERMNTIEYKLEDSLYLEGLEELEKQDFIKTLSDPNEIKKKYFDFKYLYTKELIDMFGMNIGKYYIYLIFRY
jgi:hypothetical protein